MIHYIKYRGAKYPARKINAPNMGEVTVSTGDLWDVLNDPYCDEAEKIDESILFYVSAEEITLPKKELEKIVAGHCK